MSADSTSAHFQPIPAQRRLQHIGLVGAVLALLVLAASILLRLTTEIDPLGRSSSTLAPLHENLARLLHRLSASGVALLALWAVVLSWKYRRLTPHWLQATVWIAVSILSLAVIGPLSSGYRLGVVTVVNVSFGLLLLMSFWWLREAALLGPGPAMPLSRFSWAALAALMLQVITGASASAWAMQGVHWPSFVHLACLVFVLILLGVVLLGQYHRPWQRKRSVVLRVLLASLVVTGYVLMSQDRRPVWLSLLHALLVPLLAASLVSLLKHSHRPSPSADDRPRPT